jgi:folylpolyglutamate synthase/dihydropteroate synthase
MDLCPEIEEWQAAMIADAAENRVAAKTAQNRMEAIRNQRLKKRIRKLTQQRDAYKGQLRHFQEVVTAVPMLRYRHKKYADEVAEQQRVKDLEARVKEQALLINALTESQK